MIQESKFSEFHVAKIVKEAMRESGMKPKRMAAELAMRNVPSSRQARSAWRQGKISLRSLYELGEVCGVDTLGRLALQLHRSKNKGPNPTEPQE